MCRLVSPRLTPMILLVLGCSSSEPEPDLSAILGNAAAETTSEPDPVEFDFGTVLARDQALRHEFRLANRSDRPLRLLGSKVKVPCCSELGLVPESIGPRGEVTIPAFLKVGHAADRKRIAFEIKTDSPTQEIRTLIATARFVPQWEVEEAAGDRGPLKIGQPSQRAFRVTGRRKAGEGMRAPTQVEATGAVELASASPPTEVEGSDGIIESARVVTVRLPGQPHPGDQLGTLTFRWPDGTSRIQEIRWSVKPSLELSPPGVVLKPGSGTKEVEVEVRSDDRPFRVVKVSGDLLAGDVRLPDQPAMKHILRIALDPSRVIPGVKPVVEVATDHPDQPTLLLRMLVLPPEKGDTR
jgi:hypothetical protein